MYTYIISKGSVLNLYTEYENWLENKSYDCASTNRSFKVVSTTGFQSDGFYHLIITFSL